METEYQKLVNEGWLDIEQVRQALGLKSSNYVRQLIKSDKLSLAKKATPPGGRPKWMIHPNSVEAFRAAPRAGKKRYILILNVPPENVELCVAGVRQYLTANFNESEYEFYPNTRPPKNPRKKKSTVPPKNEQTKSPVVDF